MQSDEPVPTQNEQKHVMYFDECNTYFNEFNQE